VYEWTQRREIDEHKLIPLFLGVASYGILIAGVLNWGTPGGGYFGVTEGDYAFQHAEVNLLWQAIGLAVCIAAGLATGALVSAMFGGRLVESEERQVTGADANYWEIIHDLEPPLVTTGNGERSRAAVGAGDGDPATPSEMKTTPPGP
jgi:hypothetical protein